VKGKVIDKDGGFTEYSQPVTIDNVNPSVTAAATQAANEGASASLSLGSFTDPGADSPWAVDVDWGDGSSHGAAGKSATGSLGSLSHTYDDNGPYTVTVKVTDKDHDSGSASFTVNVANVNPMATLSNSGPVDEGSPVSVSFSDPSDPSGADTAQGFHYAFACNGGSLATATYAGSGSSASTSCTFNDNGSYTVRGRIVDKDGGYSESTTTVSVANVNPTVTAPFNQLATEGTTKSFGLGSFSDPGADSPWAIDVDWGDGSTHDTATKTATGSLGSMSHLYADNGTYTVTVTVKDKDLASGSATFSVGVTNVNPTATFNAPPSVNEGSTIFISLTGASDPSSADKSAGLHYAFECDGGSLAAATYAGTDTTSTASCPTSDNGTRTVRGRIIDKDGGFTEYSKTVTVNNVNPAVAAATNQSAYEGASKSFNLGSFTDPGYDSPWHVDVNWGDGSGHTLFDVTGAGAASSLTIPAQSHTYDDGLTTPTVTVKVTDKDGGYGSASFTVTVANVAPTASLGNDGPVNEASPATISFASQLDPSTADTTAGFHYAYSCSGGAITATYGTGSSTSSSTTCTFNDGPASKTVTGRIIDKDGGSTDYSTTVIVNNVAPAVTAPGDQTANEGTPKSFTLGSFADPGADSPWAVDVNWGDGSAHTMFNLTSAGTITAQSHTYADNGTYTVTVKVTDKDGGCGTKTFTVTVANVPPTVTPPANQASNEGTSTSFNLGSFTDPGAEGTSGWTVDVDWGDATANTTFQVGSTGTIAAKYHTYDDGPATRTVKVTVTDKDRGTDFKTFTVMVSNIKPTAAISNTGPINEGGTATVLLSGATDPSNADTTAGFHYAFSCSGAAMTATYATGGTTASTTCSYDDGPANKTVTARILDKDGGYSDYSTTVVVNNVAPTASLSNNGSVAEASPATISFASQLDPSAADTTAGFHYAYDCSGGATTTATYTTGSSTAASSTCTFNDGPADKTVAAWIFDKDGGSTRYTTSVHVNNVPPAVTAPANQSSNEGQNKLFDLGSFADPGAEGTNGWTVDVDWGDGSTQSFQLSATGTVPAKYHTYDDGPGTPTVTVKVTDKNDGTDSKTFTVTVSNVNPTATFSGATAGIWGVAYTYSFSNQSDPSAADRTAGFRYAYDCNGSTTLAAPPAIYANLVGSTASKDCTYSTPGTYTVDGWILDKDGGYNEYTKTIVVAKRTTSLVYSGDTTKQYSDMANLKATLTDQTGAGVPNRTVKFTIGTQSTTAVTDASGVATTTLKITQKSGAYTVATVFDATSDTFYTGSSDSDSFTITTEDSRAYYTGATLASTGSISSTIANVTFAATVKDITAVTDSPATDPDLGDIRNSTVKFYNVTTTTAPQLLCTASVGLVNAADTTVGTATCNAPLTASSTSGGTPYNIAIVVNGTASGTFYTNPPNDGLETVNVYIPQSNFITGGGYLKLASSSGLCAGALNSKNNFGFNVKYNKTATNLQGNMNTIVRSAASCTPGYTGPRVYQLKGNSMTSLVTKPCTTSQDATATCPAVATFNGKASIQDITNPLAPISVDGNATLQVTMTDKGEPGVADTIGITLWNKSGGLWFTSNWNATKTLEQLLGGGNLVVH
jgi:large repetitive protein